jgi:hypothetical protein
LNILTDWQPTASDIEWTENMLQCLKERAVWMVPVSKSVVHIDKIAKVFSIVGDLEDETNQRIIVCLQKIGYTFNEE